MAKKKQVVKKNKPEEKLTLKDALDQNIVEKLKQAQNQLKEAEEKKKIQEEERKRLERKQREKNKSFEELLAESSMDWKSFK
ncbi:YqkE family protein [Heyndrickxia acidicola]|uniref:YqkE family protein n=1 Tax=Heyndrickxia acidicola TaxID=209389 RepID=A0ABU6MLJ3_9BACI|nr:YqkE family protein [Heyndrickxia acidicola]MED1205267.1 YqkE family protein [Heyndrickxia acidicola]